jgi:hypothetical protein
MKWVIRRLAQVALTSTMALLHFFFRIVDTLDVILVRARLRWLSKLLIPRDSHGWVEVGGSDAIWRRVGKVVGGAGW